MSGIGPCMIGKKNHRFNCNKIVLPASFGCNNVTLILPTKSRQIILIYKQKNEQK